MAAAASARGRVRRWFGSAHSRPPRRLPARFFGGRLGPRLVLALDLFQHLKHVAAALDGLVVLEGQRRDVDERFGLLQLLAQMTPVAPRSRFSLSCRASSLPSTLT